MIIIKFLILLTIFGGSTSIGYLISKKYKNRVIELKEFKNAINMLETKMKFTYEPLPEIFKQISNIAKDEISVIFNNASKYINKYTIQNAWKKSLDHSKERLNLNKEDITIIEKLGNMLRKN